MNTMNPTPNRTKYNPKEISSNEESKFIPNIDPNIDTKETNSITTSKFKEVIAILFLLSANLISAI